MTFKTRREYRGHFEKVHASDSYICPHCDKTFKRKSNWQRHKAEKHKSDASLIVCDLCPYSAPRKSNVDRHKKKVHLGKIQADDPIEADEPIQADKEKRGDERLNEDNPFPNFNVLASKLTDFSNYLS